MNLLVIPARGGSKRIPRKNIRDFCGKPMIAWSIEAAQSSTLIDEVMVSTDDTEIADVARDCGALVSFKRPAELSGDHTPTKPVIQHAINQYTLSNPVPSYVCCLYPAAPFVTGLLIDEVLSVLKDSSCDFSFPIKKFDHPIQRGFSFENDTLKMLDPNAMRSRTQDLEEFFHDAGQLYWGTYSAWMTASTIFESRCTGLNRPDFSGIDIDEQADWDLAEAIFKAGML